MQQYEFPYKSLNKTTEMGIVICKRRNKMKENMIYNLNTHSINIRNRYNELRFSLTIDTLELVIDFRTKRFLYVQGYFPLLNTLDSTIELPKEKKGDYFFDNIDVSNINPYDVFSLADKQPQSETYLKKFPRLFDKEKGIIQLGSNKMEKLDFIKINNNLIIGQDNKFVIKCMYIIPDKFE